MRGIERSVWRYAAAEAIELLTADQPRKRSPPRRDETIEAYVRGITHGLDITFEAVVDGGRETRYGQPTEEVSAAPPMPDETAVGESGQPEEEVEDESLNTAIMEGIRAQVGDVVNFLETGKVKLGDREHTFCVACGSSRLAEVRDILCGTVIPSSRLFWRTFSICGGRFNNIPILTISASIEQTTEG